MKKFYVIWTYSGYSGVMEVYGDTEENILKSLYFYSEDFQKKAKIHISENPPVFSEKL